MDAIRTAPTITCADLRAALACGYADAKHTRKLMQGPSEKMSGGTRIVTRRLQQPRTLMRSLCCSAKSDGAKRKAPLTHNLRTSKNERRTTVACGPHTCMLPLSWPSEHSSSSPGARFGPAVRPARDVLSRPPAACTASDLERESSANVSRHSSDFFCHRVKNPSVFPESHFARF